MNRTNCFFSRFYNRLFSKSKHSIKQCINNNSQCCNYSKACNLQTKKCKVDVKCNLKGGMHSQNADQHISAWYHLIDKLALIELLPLGEPRVHTPFSENGRTVYIAKKFTCNDQCVFIT